MGGDVYYTASAILSTPLTETYKDVRLFGFFNMGALAGLNGSVNLSSFVNSTRSSVGVGICSGTPIGKVEATYAIPLRFSPRDARRSVQAGFGLTFG